MKLQLAYDYESFAAGDVVNVEPESEAQRLLAEGRARIPDDEAQPEENTFATPFGPGVDRSDVKVTKAKATSSSESKS
jgi:hypothetical protein